MFDLTPETDQPLMQSPAFAAALRLCGQAPVLLPSGHLVLHRRMGGIPVAMIPRALPPPDLKTQMQQVGLGHIPLILSPERPLGRFGLRLRKNMHTAEIDLSVSDPIRRRALHPKWRNQLKQAEKSLLRLRHAPMQVEDPLVPQEAAQARQKGYRNWPVALTQAFASVAPEQTQVFTASLKGHVVAQMLFLLHGTRATYHIGLTTDTGRTWNAHNLILWQAQTWLAQQGINRLDLGVLDPRTPQLNRFKQRAGARSHQMGGTWLRWSPLAGRPSA